MIKKLKDKIKKWWRKNICGPVPPGQEDMFDEWNPNQIKYQKKINKNFEINKYGDDDFATPRNGKINMLIKGDIIEELSKMESESIDCIVTSPPYWKGFAYEAYFNSYAQYLRWSTRWMRECKRVLKHSGTFYLNVINDSEITVRAFDLMNIATEELMYKLHDTIIWYRYNQQPANTTRQLTNQCEYVFMLRHTSDGVNLNKNIGV